MKSTGESQTGLISRKPGRLSRKPGRLSRKPGRLSRKPGRLSRKPGRLISIHTGAFRAVGILRRKGSASGPTVSKVDTPLN
jgi:hypothetical protein